MTRFPLRRAERAMPRDEALAVLDAAEFAIVSTVDDDGMPYGVPLSSCGEAIRCTSTPQTRAGTRRSIFVATIACARQR